MEFFNEGISYYTNGDFENAKLAFHDALAFKKDDFPTMKLLEFMEHHDFVAPEGWDGYWDFEAGH